MFSGGYSYTNDLDEGGMQNAATHRREQNHSPLAQVVAEMGGSHSNYDYLDSLSVGFDNTDIEDVQAALALEDFVGVDGSDLQSELFESNSVFDIGADEPGTRTPSVASQQSVSGTDFDTLPIAPIAKRPIDAPSPPTATTATAPPSMTRRYNALNTNYGTSAPDAPNLTMALIGDSPEVRNPASPLKYLDFYGISSPSANPPQQQPQHHLNGSVKHGKENVDHALISKHGSGLAGSSVGPYGIASRGALKAPCTDTTSRNPKSVSANAVSTRSAPPAPPVLQPSNLPNGDGEGFGFGIETFLHGNQFGFGRQPSFKRIASGAPNPASNTSKPYYLMPGVSGEGGGGGGGAANTSSELSKATSQPGRSTRTTGATDGNAEAFTNWLEALDPKADSAASSARGVAANSNNTVKNAALAGPSVGEDFKREVDVMMRDLLGDYDLTSGMTSAFAPNNSVASGLPLPGSSTAGGTASGQRGSLPTGGSGGGKDAMRPLEYDAFLKDVRTQAPTAATGVAEMTKASKERRKPLVKTTKAAIATVGPNPEFALEGKRMSSVAARPPPQLGTATEPKSILNAAAPVGTTRTSQATLSSQDQQQQQQQQPAQTPDASSAQSRRRRAWNDSAPARRSGEGISGAALDPFTETQAAAKTPKSASRRVSETSAAAQPAPSAGTGTGTGAGLHHVAMSRAPRPAAVVVAAAAASEHSAHGRKASPRQPSSPRAEPAKSKAPPASSGGTYEDIDQDLLAGGYMTSAPMLRSTESLSEAQSLSKRDDETVMLVPSSPPKEDRKGGAAGTSSSHGRRFSQVDGQIGASLLRQKWHPSWTKNETSSTAGDKSPEQVSDVKKFVATPVPATTSTSALPAEGALRKLSKQASPSPSSDATRAEPTEATPQRRTSIPSLAASRTQLSIDYNLQANLLPLPSFTPNRVFAADSLRGASANATSPMQRDSVRRGTSVIMADSIGKTSRRASTSPSTVEPIVLPDRERPGFLQQVTARSDSRDDADISAVHATTTTAKSNATQPRRRLTEFRSGCGESGLPPSMSRSRVSVGTTAEETRNEAAKQRDRERETQQANEERRQRIQAFMAKRKAEKRREELRRGQLIERDRQMEAYREEQERQRIHNATAPEAVAAPSPSPPLSQSQQAGVVAGSGLNAIKASQRTHRPTPERLLRLSVPTSGFIPDAATMPMTPPLPPHNELSTAGAVKGAPRRKRNPSPSSTTTYAAASKSRVRAVVVFMSSSTGDDGAVGSAAKEADAAEEQRRSFSGSSTMSSVAYKGTSVAMELNKADYTLKVQQPQERTRYYHVDEYVPIHDSNPCASSKSSDKAGGGVAGSHNATGTPRRRIISLTLTEMSRKFLAGVNVALLLGSTENAQDAAVLAVREVVEGVVSHMPAQSQLFASVAYVTGGNTEDLLVDPPRSVRSTFDTSPLYGPTLNSVEYVSVKGVGHLLRTIADAYKRVKVGQPQPQPQAGLLVISLLLKQCRGSDVILSSYLISDAGTDSSIYTAILRKSQHVPFALFHSALGGPTLTTALMAADAADVTAVVPLLNVQHRLSTVVNKPCHVGSVRRFMELAQQELDTSDGRPSKVNTPVSGSNNNNNNNSSRHASCSSLSNNTVKSGSTSKLSSATRQQLGASRPQIRKRLVEQVAMARRILDDPQGYLPKSGLTVEDSLEGVSVTMHSVPSTAPPSAAAAPRTQLTKKQQDEMKEMRLTSAGQKRKASHVVPATAVAAAAPAAPTSCTDEAAAAAAMAASAGANKAEQAAAPGSSGVVLPSIASGATAAAAAPWRKSGARADLTAPARAPPLVSAVPLKHPGLAPTELSSSLPPAVRSSNNVAAAAASHEAQGTPSSVRRSHSSPADAALSVSQVRGSRDGDRVAAAAHSARHSISDEQSVSASAEYVRRGCGDYAAQGNTGFMNFEDVAASQSVPFIGKGTMSQNSITSSSAQQRLRSPSKLPEHAELPPRPATTMASTSESAVRTTAGRRGGSADSGWPSSGFQRVSPSSPANGGSGVGAPPVAPMGTAGKKLLPGATTIGSNGPQWPSTPAFEIPTIPSVASIDTSLTHDVSISMRQSSNTYESEKGPIPTSTKVRTLVVVDSRCRETSNVTYDNTMVIATTEDDFEEYDVDEVLEATPGQTELIQAELLKELRDTLLRGCNAAILGADSRPTGFSAQVLKSVVHSIFVEMNREGTHRSGRLSASIVKVKGESVVDLLTDSGEAQKLVIAISPLFGSCVHGVTYADIASGAAFNDVIDAALHRATALDNGRDYGFLFCSLLFKLRLEEEGDVQVCSLVATFAGENVGLYTSVLDCSPLVPRALFHYALGGPSYTIALLGIGSEETRANQMLQVQKRLGEMSNRATHPGSVAKFVAGIRNDLTPNLIAKYENSRDPAERAATKEMIERLAEMVKDADALLGDFDHHQPKAYLHGDANQQDSGADKKPAQPQQSSLQLQLHRTPSSAAPSNQITAASRDSGSNDNVSKTQQSNDASVFTPQSTSSSARPSAAARALPSITAVNPEAEGERIQSLVCFKQVMMGAGTVAVQGNSILCASQGGTRFDSDEVIICDEKHRSLSSKLMDELVAKFLSGHHTGLLAADSSYSAFTPLMLRQIANRVLEAVLGGSADGQEEDNGFAFTKPPTISGELQVSIALIKDDVTADLLPIDVDATYHRFEMEHTPLYGPRVVGVTPHLVANPQDFDHFLAVAIDNADPALQTADPGIMVVSLVLTQRVTKPVEDVLVSSLLCTAVFDAVHHYERMLEGNPGEPLDLFKNVLRGPCFSVAMLGISDEEEDPGKLLRALNDLSQVRNRAPQVNSVSRHIRELQRGIVKLKERMTTSSNEDEKAYIQSRVEMAEKLLEEAESLQRNPLSLMQPRAFVPLGGNV